jgi:hypothetical protein
MEEFVRKHEAGIHGVLSCFDRMLFRGYLPIMSGWSMAQFLNPLGVSDGGLKPFLLENAERLKAHAIAMAQKQGRPFQYLSSKIRKEEEARKLAERDGIEDGLVCIFSMLEPCRTFSFRFQPGRLYVQSARRKCLHLYYYFMDRHFGLIHVAFKLGFHCRSRSISMGTSGSHASWRPIRCAIPSTTTSFCGLRTWTEREPLRANRFVNLNWPAILNQYARRVNPQLHDILQGCQYYSRERAERILDRHPLPDSPRPVRALPTTS